MEKRQHLYVSRKNVLTWLMALCLGASAVVRILVFGVKGTDGSVNIWTQIILPVAAAGLYVFIALVRGKETFYQTAIPIWMMAIYGGLWASRSFTDTLHIWFFWAILILLAVFYTHLTSGRQQRVGFGLVLILALPLSFSLYHNRQNLADFEKLLPALPDMLMLLGIELQILALKTYPAGEYHRTWGDRCDGRRLRTLPAMSQVSPYIMVERNNATNSFEESFEVTHIDRYIRQKRREGLTGFGLTHVFLAAYCRGVAKYPGLNRFLSGQKIYSRGNDIQFCMTVKKEMTNDSPDTIIKLHLTPADTAEDVYRKMNAAVEKVKNPPLDSSFDNTDGALPLVPGVVLKILVWLLKTLDYFGLLPAFLLEISPFHGSVFFTSMGSLGIPPIYHHLYNFGNLPVFGSFGCKRRTVEVQEDGSLVLRKYVDFKYTMDERIVDGCYYASFFKHYKRILLHPEILDTPPTEINRDID